MKKITSFVFALVFVFATAFTVVQAEETTSTTQSQINALMVLVQQLKEQLTALQNQNKELKQEVSSLREFTQNLSEGLSNEDVKDVQQILSGYEDIYPEGVVSGYYGPLTKEAVKRFQKKLGLEATGVVGPETRKALNDLLDDGELSQDELKTLPAGIAGKRGLDKPLPPGIWKNLKEKRGFAKMEDSKDESEDDSKEDRLNLKDHKGGVQSKIIKAKRLAYELKKVLDTSDETQSEYAEAEKDLNNVKTLVKEAQDALFNKNLELAKTKAEDAIDLAKDALDSLKNGNDSSDDEDETEHEDETETEDETEDEDN